VENPILRDLFISQPPIPPPNAAFSWTHFSVISTYLINFHWCYFDISNGFLTNRQNISKNEISSERSLQRKISRSKSCDTAKHLIPNQSKDIDLTNEPIIIVLWSVVQPQCVRPICVTHTHVRTHTHTHTRTMLWHYRYNQITATEMGLWPAWLGYNIILPVNTHSFLKWFPKPTHNQLNYAGDLTTLRLPSTRLFVSV